MIPEILHKDEIDQIQNFNDFDRVLSTIKASIQSTLDFKVTSGCREGLKLELITAATNAHVYLKETRPEYFL